MDAYGLILDVRNGDLFEGTGSSMCGVEQRRVDEGRNTWHLRWSSITLRAVKQPRQKKTRGHGHDWEGAWAYALTLRADDQWDWKKYRRDEKQPLPSVHKVVEDKIKNWFEAKGNVPNISGHSPERYNSALCGQAHAKQAQALKSARGVAQPPSATISHDKTVLTWGEMSFCGACQSPCRAFLTSSPRSCCGPSC